MTTIRQRAESKAWEVYSKTPKEITHFTDPLIKTGFKINKKLHSNPKKGAAWIEKHNPLNRFKKKKK